MQYPGLKSNKNKVSVILTLFLMITLNAYAAKVVTVHGLPGCIELKNENTRVVIDPNIGGRVLVYELNGKDIMYFNRKNEGITDGSKVKNVDAGRFDFGPVKTIPDHKFYFKGKWIAKITGEYSVRVTSHIDPRHNILLIRDFILDKNSSKLTCKQTLVNKDVKPLTRYLWSRTFVKGGGVYLMPVNPESRFPKKYVIYIRKDGKSMIDYIPDDEPNVSVENNILTMTGPSIYKRLLADGVDGWLACLFKDNLLFVKTYPVYPDKKYGGISCFTASVWHFKDEIYEIEAMGPLKKVLPGEAFSFTEEWHLSEYPFPENRKPDINAIKETLSEF